MSPPVRRIVETRGAPDQLLASPPTQIAAWRARWDELVDSYLIEWGRDPSRFDGEEIVPPTEASIGRACEVAGLCRDGAWPPPLRVVPDGEGGVVFERRVGDIFESLEILADGRVELNTFKDCRLLETRCFLPNSI